MPYFRIVLGALALASLLPAEEGPSHMIVTYRAIPEKRAALRVSLSGYGARFTHWRDQGVLGAFQILVNPLTDDEAWDSLVLARMGSRGMELFKRVEPPDTTSIYNTTTIPADLIDRGGDGDEALNTGVFLVVPYDCRASVDVQRQNLSPVLNDSIKAGALLGFRFFIPRFPAGRSWNGLLVLHYPDWLAVGKRDLPTFKTEDVCAQRVTVIAEALQTR